MNSVIDIHPNYKLLESFYQAFANRDHEKMNEAYNPESTSFYDPVFQDLNATEVRKMWKMLCLRGKDLMITYQILEADEYKGKANWQAHYTFSGTGKKVLNKIQSSFTFKDGRILTHRDEFDLYAWAKQAFGLTGTVLGWTSWFQNKVRHRAKTSLEQFR